MHDHVQPEHEPDLSGDEACAETATSDDNNRLDVEVPNDDAHDAPDPTASASGDTHKVVIELLHPSCRQLRCSCLMRCSSLSCLHTTRAMVPACILPVSATDFVMLSGSSACRLICCFEPGLTSGHACFVEVQSN